MLSQLPQQIFYEAVDPAPTANTTQSTAAEVSVIAPSTSGTQAKEKAETKTVKDGEEVREERNDSDSEVEDQQTFTDRDRIRKVRQMLLGDVVDNEETEEKTVLSMDKRVKLEKGWLPPSESFFSLFQEFSQSVSQRDRRDVSNVMKIFKIRMNQYRIKDNPWEKLPKMDTGLLESTVFPDSRHPRVLWDMKSTEEMEKTSRDISVASYVDMFL